MTRTVLLAGISLVSLYAQVTTYPGGSINGTQGQTVVSPLIAIAALPSASTNSGTVYWVKDGNSATDCATGGGAFLVACRSNGSNWAVTSSFITGSSPTITSPSFARTGPTLTYTVGTGGVTANSLVTVDASGNVVTPAAGGGGFAIAQSTVAASGSVQVQYGGLANCTMDGASTIGHLAIPSATNAGYCSDSGQSSSTLIPSNTAVIGSIRTVSASSGNPSLIQIHGPGVFGTKPLAISVRHVFSAAGTSNFVHGLNTSTPLSTCYVNSGSATYTSSPVDANTVSITTNGAADITCSFAYAPAAVVQ